MYALNDVGLKGSGSLVADIKSLHRAFGYSNKFFFFEVYKLQNHSEQDPVYSWNRIPVIMGRFGWGFKAHDSRQNTIVLLITKVKYMYIYIQHMT